MKLGFIGLGTMGARMASNLQSGNHHLVVHDLNPDNAKACLDRGAEWADSVAELAKQVDVVFLSLPGPAEVEQVALGEAGLLHNLGKGAACFDLSTNAPSTVRHIQAVFAEQSLHFLDAPVSGGPAGAKSGKLAILVGGERAVFDEFEPVIRSMSDQPRYIGEIGAGSVAKLVHNCAGYMIQTVFAEVFSMGIKAGVEPTALWEAVRQCALGRRRTADGLADQFLPDQYEPAAFALKLAHKDVRLATQLGREVGVPMRLANLTFEEMTEALNREGWADKDSRIAMKLQTERAGVELGVPREVLDEIFARDPKAT